MVQLNSSFSAPTPHGGPPFSNWKLGWGFGKRCRSYMKDPAMPVQGRYTPSGDGYYGSSRFWRGKYEIGPASGFGVGDRPDYGALQGDWSIAPNAYGDVSAKLSASKRDVVYKDMKMKPRFLSVEQKYAMRPEGSGPGPCAYDVRIKAGDAGWARGSKNPKWTINCRHLDSKLVVEESRKPGPTDYTTRGKAGENYPIKHGTLYDITMGGRLASQDDVRQKGPGPGQYTLAGDFDKYGGGMPPPSHGGAKKRSSSAHVRVVSDLRDAANEE